MVNGPNPYECHHAGIFTFVKVPPPVSRYEPSYVCSFTAVDHVETGKDVHIRVHNGHNIELKAAFSTLHQNCCSLLDTKIILKVQHPLELEEHMTIQVGTPDHLTTLSITTSYVAFELKGDSALYY